MILWSCLAPSGRHSLACADFFLGAHAPLEIAPVSESVSESVSQSVTKKFETAS